MIMGVITEGGIRAQAKKGQEQANSRLDELIAIQKVTNNLLSRILAELTNNKTP